MVLATDMKQHFSLLSHFNTVHRLAAFTKPGAGTSTPQTSVMVGPGGDLGTVVLEGGAPDAAPKPADDTERLLSLQLAIKVRRRNHEVILVEASHGSRPFVLLCCLQPAASHQGVVVVGRGALYGREEPANGDSENKA